MSKYMCSRYRPNCNTGNGLTPNGGRPAGAPPGSAPERNAPGSPRASAAAEAPGGSGGQAADVDELAATLGRPRRAAGLETEASSRPGTAARSARVVGGQWPEAHPTGLKATRASPDIEPDAQPATQGQRRVARRVDILADVARANPFTPPPGGPFSVRR